MGNFKGAYLMPHPPIIIPEIGLGEERKAQMTIDAMNMVSEEIAQKRPDTIILISPHGSIFEDGIAVMAMDRLAGDFGGFGQKGLAFGFNNNLELVQRIMDEAQRRNILCVGVDRQLAREYSNVSLRLDWGALVPLYYVNKRYRDFRLVHISVSMLPYEELYDFGAAVQRAIELVDDDVVVIASGDLSHKLKDNGPYGYDKAGPALDKFIVDKLAQGDIEGLFQIDRSMISKGGECGLRSIIISLGTMEGYSLNSRILSYEGPFGVGYCVASFENNQDGERREFIKDLFNRRRKQIEDIKGREDAYVSLARIALETYVNTGIIVKSDNVGISGIEDGRAGVFVSIKKHGQLRGCIGTIEPSTDSIAEEIIRNAIKAGVNDPRFLPVEAEELPDLLYSVDVLKEPEQVDSIDLLDPKKYGIIVESVEGDRRGLLLPNLEGVNTTREQIGIALHKAAIAPDEEYLIKRFQVIRHNSDSYR